MKKIFLSFAIISILSLFSENIFSQKNKFEFLPDGINFLPLRANMQEAKLGILYYPGNANLKVDIGNSMDLFAIHFPDDKSKLTFGVEFMAYASVIGYQQLRLQIDAIDGFFGGSAAYSKLMNDNLFQIRFRIIHNSAHLVDGNWWATEHPRTWRKPGGPIPFTRDFGELIFANNQEFLNSNFRYYLGGAYAVLVRPKEIKRFSALTGLEIHSEKLLPKLLSKPTNIFFAYHLNVAGYPKYTGTNQIQLGIKFGEWQTKGVAFYTSYFSGNNMISEYYNERVNQFGIGFRVDFP
ncbi:MAG: hypothetical protein C0425_05520 [Chlorobiaceae bacterium]|nr:hypothetical protein [Chlorobiaceae bacterium]MBA4309777.1 hypothetical protein [Chlorobiaceae bacterium]